MMQREGYLAKVNAIPNKKIKLKSTTKKNKKKKKNKHGKKKKNCKCEKKRMAKDTMYA